MFKGLSSALSFAISLNLNFANLKIFTNLPMIARIIEFKNKNLFVYTYFMKLTILSQIANLNSMYVFIL